MIIIDTESKTSEEIKTILLKYNDCEQLVFNKKIIILMRNATDIPNINFHSNKDSKNNPESSEHIYFPQISDINNATEFVKSLDDNDKLSILRNIKKYVKTFFE